MLHGLNSSSRRVLSDLKCQIDQGHHHCEAADEIPDISKHIEHRRSSPAAQRTGVQRPATVLTETDPATVVCRRTATKVN
jgi:hypothetical protein